MSNDGWIKVFRKIKDWEWFSDSNTFKIFLYLVMEANHKPKKWQGTQILRGQLITGRKKIALECKCSEMVVRTSLERLKTTNEITIQTTNRFSIITICNYDTYQSEDYNNNQQANQQITNKQPTDNQQIATTKNDKNDKNDKNLIQESMGADAPGALKKVKKIFIPPTIEEIKAYIQEKDLKGNADSFFNHYEANGWRYGKAAIKMADWKAALRNWRSDLEYKQPNQATNGKMSHDEALRIAGERIKEEERLARLRPASLENHNITGELVNDF